MKICTWCLKGSNPPIKTGPKPLWLALPPPHLHHMTTLKSSPKICAPPSPINMATMIRQHKKFCPSAIRLSAQILILAIASLLFISVSILCELAMLPDVYILLSPQEEVVHFSS